MPSSLDSHGFTEDAPLSEWVAEGYKHIGVVAALGSLDEKPALHKKGTPWPDPASDSDPISVELVRGHDGPDDDSWTVVVDGLRCAKTPTSGDNPVSCYLPPPFRKKNDDGTFYKQGIATVARSLAVAVRMESEARMPVQAQLVIEQVCRSKERINRAASAQDEVMEIGRITVEPYSVSDPIAKTVIVPYPFCAPAQSALAICSYREIERWRQKHEMRNKQNQAIEKDNARRAHDWNEKKVKARKRNIAARFLNYFRDKRYAEKMTDWEKEKQRVDDEHKKAMEEWEQKKPEDQGQGALGPFLLNEALNRWKNEKPVKEKVRKPTKEKKVPISEFKTPKPIDRNWKPLPPAPLNSKERTHVIGGNEQSVARCLAQMLQRFTVLCQKSTMIMDWALLGEQNVADGPQAPSSQSTSLEDVGKIIRHHLLDSNDTAMLAFFDALVTATPADTDLLNAIAANPSEKRVRGFFKEIAKRDQKNTEMVYDRIDIVPRLQTTTFIRMRIEVTEHDGMAPATVLLRTRDYDAVAAHSVYAGHYQDLSDFNDAADEFLSALDGVGKARDDENAVQRAMKNIEEQIYNLYPLPKDGLVQWLRGDVKGEEYELNTNHVTAILNELKLVLHDMTLTHDELRDTSTGEDDDPVVPGEYNWEAEEDAPSPLAPLSEAFTQTRTSASRKLPQIVHPLRNSIPKLRTPIDITMADEAAAKEQETSWNFGPLKTLFSFLFWVGLTIANLRFRQSVQVDQEAKQVTESVVTDAWNALLATLIGGATGGQAGAAAGFFTTVKNARWTKYIQTLIGFDVDKSVEQNVANVGNFAYKEFSNVTLSGSMASLQKAQLSAAASSIIFYKNRAATNDLKDEFRQRATKAAKGSPILSSLASARAALTALSASLNENKAQTRTFGNTDTIYDHETGLRWRFSEKYDVDKALLEEAPMRNTDADWTSMFDSTAMTLFPPPDVSEQLYDALVLRRVPLLEPLFRTAGRPNRGIATTPAELAAAAAHRELIAVCLDDRSEILGEHVGTSVAQTALIFAKQGARLLEAAYGKNSGVTLVKGNDAIWSCMDGGPAARLAAKHLAIFEHADMVRQLKQNNRETVTELVRAEANTWSSTRRVLVSDFCKAWIATAQQAVQQAVVTATLGATSLLSQTDIISARAQQMAGSLARVSVLTQQQERALAVVAKNHTFLEMNDKVKALVHQFLPHAMLFRDQREATTHTSRPFLSYSEEMWAARRVDPTPQRRLVMGKGVENVVSKLAGLGLEPNEQRRSVSTNSDTCHYYCPMGARLDSTPGSVPFAVDSLSECVVFLEHLQSVAVRLHRSIVEGYPIIGAQGNVTVGTVEEQIGKGPVWLARHPLVITTRQGSVSARFDASDGRNWSEAMHADTGVTTVADAIFLEADVQARAVASNFVRALAYRARIVAYDTDRMINALALASAQSKISNTIRVIVGDQHRMLSLVFALTVLASEYGGLQNELLVHIVDKASRSDMLKVLDNVIVCADTAMQKGCRCVSLAEACVALA